MYKWKDDARQASKSLRYAADSFETAMASTKLRDEEAEFLNTILHDLNKTISMTNQLDRKSVV